MGKNTDPDHTINPRRAAAGKKGGEASGAVRPAKAGGGGSGSDSVPRKHKVVKSLLAKSVFGGSPILVLTKANLCDLRPSKPEAIAGLDFAPQKDIFIPDHVPKTM